MLEANAADEASIHLPIQNSRTLKNYAKSLLAALSLEQQSLDDSTFVYNMVY